MLNVRRQYIVAFKKGFAELKAERRSVHSEVRVEVNMETSHELYRLLVVDVLEKRADGSVGAIRLVTDPIRAEYPGLDIETPLAWHDVTMRCLPFGFPEATLLAWGNRWIHDEAPPLGEQDGLGGLIHSVSQPSLNGGLLEFNVDFGSAPFEAFEELLRAIGSHIRALRSEPGAAEA